MNIKLIFIIIIVDFSTKLFVTNWLNDGSIIIINKNLNLTLLHNYVSSELISSSYWFLLINFWICILGIFLFNNNYIKICIGLELIIGGTLGNLIDRLGHGYIIDFLSLHWLDKYYLVFNIADIAIIMGCFISLIV
ncbi:Lipoprotein signal peptidase [Candidatus Portiera aleyrodidarum]|uniref:signal peptidase II n=1 Tax=Candidatus Portiera aleyrodidarum TaxID=91844 RepID=UPI0005D95B46|nr:signal peptidase II [Candidatus Portiera aleyrodidarum]CEL12360.1 Lipoprotein signal peptidase [Candidatus Portiera aleyrodidarum]